MAPAASAGVDDFTFASMHSDFTLGRDSDGRSTLAATETLVAEFPSTDQNRGIRRLLDTELDGHDTSLRVQSVTDEAGTPRPFTVGHEPAGTTLVIAGDAFVHGRETFVIRYTMRDVTSDDEFFWNVNGSHWGQRFEEVSATITTDDALAAARTAASCLNRTGTSTWVGCTAQETASTLTVADESVWPGESLAAELRFESGTFAAAPASARWPAIGGWILGYAGYVGVPALLLLVALVHLLLGRRRRMPARRREPLPGPRLPFEDELVRAGIVLRRNGFAAAILQLAAMGMITISGRGTNDEPIEVRRIVPAPEVELTGFQQRLLEALFRPGEKMRLQATLEPLRPGWRARIGKLAIRERRRAAASELYGGRIPLVRVLRIVGVALIVLSIANAVRVGFVAFGDPDVEWGVSLFVPVLLGTLLASSLFLARADSDAPAWSRLTPEGRAARDRLLQLRVDILAGRPVLIDGVAVAPERLLPYVALFGLPVRVLREVQGRIPAAAPLPAWGGPVGVAAVAVGSLAALEYGAIERLNRQVSGYTMAASGGASTSSSGSGDGGGGGGGGGGGDGGGSGGGDGGGGGA
ncbi:DUF2207 domain-containing protein [Microbacteriaceae bacterium VKM Ac-2854]|nr:DUF2207 domain-containing protein [Microbacteriaceae bacterium VKM Ac-2854]